MNVPRFNITYAVPPDRRELVAEVSLVEGRIAVQVAEIRRDESDPSKWIMECYPIRGSDPWTVDPVEFVEAIARALEELKRRLP